jgi:hypothetical protein
MSVDGTIEDEVTLLGDDPLGEGRRGIGEDEEGAMDGGVRCDGREFEEECVVCVCGWGWPSGGGGDGRGRWLATEGQSRGGGGAARAEGDRKVSPKGVWRGRGEGRWEVP